MCLSDDETPKYQSYMLRGWEICSQVPDPSTTWRFSLEDPITGEKWGFSDFDALLIFLRASFDLEDE